MSNIDLETTQRLLRERGVCVVIPTYNNGGTVNGVVCEAKKYCLDVIVVDDGSTDTPPAQLKAIDGITVVTHATNKGKGSALKTAFTRALAMGFSYAITLDADGQHFPADIPNFLEANRRHPGSLIVGQRRLEGVERSKGSSFANKFSNFWFYIQTGCRLEDTQTGFRLYPLRKLRWLSLLTSRYEAELELMVFASWHGVRIVSIPINVYYPPKEERVSHFRPVKDFARISLLNTILCMLAIVYGLPCRLWRAAMTFVRTVYAVVFFSTAMLLVLTPFVWLYVRIGRMTEDKRIRLHHIIYKAARFVMLRHGIPGAKFRYKVHDGLTFDKPRVVICNHQSHLDLACQLIFTPKIVFLTNNWVWNNPFYGLLIRNAEYLPVVEGIDALLPHLRSLVQRGYSIAVFPEGTRSKTCDIGRFHQGAFYIADQLGLEVLPMYLYGAGKILPKKTYHLRKGQIYIEVGQPISRAELANMGDIRRQTSAIHKHYQRKYEEICNNIERYV